MALALFVQAVAKPALQKLLAPNAKKVTFFNLVNVCKYFLILAIYQLKRSA
jgi:hypothetical protein